MIITTRQFHSLYDGIKEEYYESEERKIVIFVSKLEVDSVCALRILQGFLNSEGIHYSVYPVTNYTEIQAIVATELEGNQDYKNIIMINCGATEYLPEQLDLGANSRVTIIDSRRPVFHKYNTNNAYDNVVVVVDDQDPFPLQMIPEAHDELDDYNPGGDGGAGDNSDEDDEEEGGRPARRRRLNDEGLSDEDKRLLQEQRDKRLDQLDLYYKNCGHGKPSSMILFELAHSLNYHQSVYLWCAIMGLTEQLMHMRISGSDYSHWRQNLAGYVEVAEGFQRAEEYSVEDDIKVKKPQSSAKIKLQEDFWLPMLRQWTIYDSMMCSPYMGTKMETYRDLGVDRLQLLLAKMGIPLTTSKKLWAGIAPRHRRNFRAKLVEHASDSNLSIQDMVFDSFELLHGHDLELTAADAVHAASAFLAHPDEDHRRFWRALNSLDTENGADRLRKGLEMAKSLQTRIIMDTGMAIIRNQLETGRSVLFSFLNLAEVDMLSHELFAHPTPLLRVALFVQQHVRHKLLGNKPVVVVGPPMPGAVDGQETCLVLGLGTRPKDPTKPVINMFGRLFGEVVEKLDSRQESHYSVKYGFDATVAELMKPDIEMFHEELKYSIIQEREKNKL